MRDISELPHRLDPKKNQCRVVVETPRGNRIKFKFEPESGMFEISKFLPKGHAFRQADCNSDTILRHTGVHTLSDLNKDLKPQITEYLELYNKNSGKQDRVTGLGNPQKAVALVRKASRRWEESHS
jgi:inorganic pyrophosphatase